MSIMGFLWSVLVLALHKLFKNEQEVIKSTIGNHHQQDEVLKTLVASELEKTKHLAKSFNIEDVKADEWFIQLLQKVIQNI